MQKIIPAFLILFMYSYWGLAQAQEKGIISPEIYIGMDSSKTFSESEFKNPDKTYRLLAFWSWNEKLDEAILREQIKYMDEGGWGGFFMHARGGLITKYLSGDWFKCIKVSVDEARKRGMEAWMYDENKWPSGTANLTIGFKNEAYRETHLFMAQDSIPHAKKDITVYKQLTIINPAGEKSQYYFYKWKSPLGIARFGGGSYVDLMNPDVTSEFIKSVHDKYKNEIGKDFGTTVPGIFTDDINIIWDLYGQKKLAIPWTDKMPEVFEKLNGYSIIENIDKLFLPSPGYEKVRIDFYRTVNKLFSENYWKEIYDWCDRNNLKSTGHHMGDGLPFTDLMQDFQYEQIPGMDLLAYNLGHILTLKTIGSIANQLGKERTLCEPFAATGHNLSFEDQKNLSNWLFVNGINTITAHIFQYSMLGDRKRDHPPAMSYQQPWWKKNNYMADYQARTSYLLTRGKRVTDILLLYPVESFGMVYTPNDRRAYSGLYNHFKESMDYLLQNQLDFDLGSEEIISKYGSVNSSKFEVGLADYAVLVLPSIRSIRQTTLQLLNQYIKNGGVVIATEQLPDFIDGNPITATQKEMLAGIRMIPQDKLKEQLSEITEPAVVLSSKDNKPLHTIRYSLRKDKSQLLCYFANIDLKEEFSTEISVRGTGKMYKLDLSSGQKTEIEYWTDKNRTITTHLFSPCESYALLIDTDIPKVVSKDIKQQETARSTIVQIDSIWNMELQNNNSLTIDYCRYSRDGKSFSDPVYVLDMNGLLKNDTTIKHVRYSFNSTLDYSDSAFFVLETPDKFEIRINGKAIECKNPESYIDIGFKKINIDGAIHKGENYIDLKIIKTDQLSIESVYVCGSFGVNYARNNTFELVPLKTQANANDLTKEGLTFFAGSVVLSKQITLNGISSSEQYLLKFRKLDATAAEVIVNGKNAGALCWKPYELDITLLLKNGTNTIQIALTNSLHNVLGYHHSSKRSIFQWVGEVEFNDKKNWTDDYFIVPLGISEVSIERITQEETIGKSSNKSVTEHEL